MAKASDDLDAVRQIAAVLDAFPDDDRERILRWVRERLGMKTAGSAVNPAGSLIAPASTPPAPAATDIKSFVQQKDPKTDRQLAAVVAYFYRFVAPEADRKESIAAEDLIEACRKADRERPKKPSQTLVDAFNDGYIDRTADRGKYMINSVGENLVAMVLPGDAGGSAGGRRPRAPRGRKPKKTITRRRAGRKAK